MMAVLFFPGTYLLTSFLAFWLRVILGAHKTPLWKWGCLGVAAAQAFLLSVNTGAPAAIDKSFVAPDGKARAMVIDNLSDLSDFQYMSGVYINPNYRAFIDRSQVAVVFEHGNKNAAIRWDGAKKLVIELQPPKDRGAGIHCFDRLVAGVEVVITPPVNAPSCLDPKAADAYWSSKP